LKNHKKQSRQKPEQERSLFGEILDWMLAPLLFVWPISIALTYYFANNVASFPYDQALREHVSAIARLVVFTPRNTSIVLPASAKSLLRSDEVDNIYFRVKELDGETLAGDKDLPPVDSLLIDAAVPGEVYFRDIEHKGQDVRVAYTLLDNERFPSSHWVLVEVAETLEKRAQLANKIIASVIVPQFIIIPLAVFLVWFGLTKGLQPLTRLRETIELRAAGDLSPIATQRVPEELSPLIESFNGMLHRMELNMDAQRRFIDDAAHQMRTPLTGLKTQAQLALRESDPTQLHASLVQIANGVDRAARLVNQLLILARTEAGDQNQHPMSTLDFNALLREIVEDWVVRALDKGLDLGFEPSMGAAKIDGNPFLLREMCNNLLDNALRYTPENGAVTARVTAHGDFVIFEIEDNGIGIAEEQAELVFERFYRVSDSGTEGSGLGLPIVREIASQHRASVSLRPNQDKGTVACVVFPTSPERTTHLATVPLPIQTGFA
jgi:two-component system, OmpR family, sensor histidine kinase TctE